MASKNLLFLGLVFAMVLFISSDLVSSASDLQPQTKEGEVKVDGHHHCHHPHCADKTEEIKSTDETTSSKSSSEASAGEEKVEDGHYKHKCKHYPHC